jgi:hypothetical protein
LLCNRFAVVLQCFAVTMLVTFQSEFLKGP